MRSVEEKILQYLLAAGGDLPPVAELPPAEAFLVPACRNIYAAFVDLYESGGRRPDAAAVLAKLPEKGEEVDRTARLLLEGAAGLGPVELEEAIRQLSRRWQQQRLKELAAQIAEAQRGGDREKLDRLLSEKTELSSLLHRRPSS